MGLRILTVIQARTGSTRLPGKVLLPLGNRTLLAQMYHRVAGSRLAGEVIVATTTDSQDDAVVSLCEAEGIECFRGHPTDLLDRHYRAMKAFRADAVVKIPSDCPLIDPAAIDAVLGQFETNAGRYDYLGNLHPQSWPDGNDVEVMTATALEVAWREAKQGFEREHTTPFLWDNPGRFRIGNVAWERGLDLSKAFRWTIDYPEDYQLIKAVFEALYPRNHWFGVEEILELLEKRPDIRRLNAKHLGDGWYNKHRHELKTLSTEGVGGVKS